MTCLDEIKLVEKHHDFGIVCDVTFTIYEGDKKIGRCACSEVDREGAIQLEWIEFYPEYRGKKKLRETLDIIATYFSAVCIQLKVSEENLPKYKSVGAKEYDYDDFTEMYEMEMKY